MSKPLSPIKILRPGTFTDIRGTKVTFTPADLAEIAASYDVTDPAPLVIGHPKHDDPAYGWAGAVRVDDGKLVVDPDQVAPEFAEIVNAGRYKRISASFYPPKDPANPSPGRWRLKHVGFLGAMAPSIKGLGTVSLGEADATTTIELSEEEFMPNTTVDLAEREAALEAREAAIKQREEVAAQAAQAALHQEHVSFAEALIKAVKLAPAGRAKVIGLMDQLGEVTEAVSFGEGDAAETLTPLAAFKSLFDGAHPVIALGEHAPADKAVSSLTTSVNFAAPAGFTVEADQAALHSRAKVIQAANPGMQFWDAFNQARAEPAA